MLPDATARETVARHTLALERKPRSPDALCSRVTIVSTNHELRTTLADVARAGGFLIEATVAEPAEAPPGILTVWDVPVLEPNWPARLGMLAKLAPVVALLGFADRQTVSLARQQGAVACLDLPCEVADLQTVLDRLTMGRLDQAHEVPPSPMGIRGRSTVPGRLGL